MSATTDNTDNNEKKKPRLRLNLFDALVILVFIAAIALGYLYFSSGGLDGERKDVYFTVELRNMEEDFAEKISVGDDINDSVKGYYLGKVESVETKQQTAVIFDNEQNRFVESPVEGKYFVYVTIKANGSESDAEIKAEDVVIRVGKELYIKGKGYAQAGYCTALYTRARGAAQ